MAAANVSVKYGQDGNNLSITKHGNRITKVTTWKSGITGSTERVTGK